MPQPHKCIKCEHEFNFSPHNYNIAPMTSEKDPVCPKCWDEFLKSIGIGYGTTAWTKDGSAYEQMKSRIEDTKQCWCHKCIGNTLVSGSPFPITFSMTHMILCPTCGNKRCPKASDHTLECTNSNAPNQAGSVHSTTMRKTTREEKISRPGIYEVPSESYRDSSASGRPPEGTD